ncbi:MAG TPA: O-antigen ligase family protein [Acidobacteriota bacterium]|nr:O-antigen ligase family protein [Acidobacteriota bacterium]
MAQRKGTGSRVSRGSDFYLRLGAAGLFLLLPFVISTVALDKFRLTKDLYLTAGALVLIALFLITRQLRMPSLPGKWEAVLAVGVVYAGINSLFAEHQATALSAFSNLFILALFLLVLSEIWEQDFLRRLWLALAVVGAVHSVMTVLQYYGYFSWMLSQQGTVIEGRAVPAGLIGEVQSGAFFFGLCVLLNLYWLVRVEGNKLRAAVAGILLINLTGLIFTRTLTALAAFGAGLLFWAAYHHWQHFRRGRGVTRAMALLWAGLAAGLVVGGMAAHQAGLIERIQTVTQQIRQGDWSVATAGRQPVYELTWEMIREDPLLGRGLDAFGIDFFHYRADTEVGRQKKLLEQPGAFREVHNEYLQAWLDLGLPGFLIFLVLLFWPLWLSLKRAFDLDGDHDPYWWALYAGGILFLAVECLAFFPFQAPLPLALTILLYSGMRAGQRQPATQADPHPLSSNAGKIKALLVTALALLALYPRVQTWRANQLMGEGERFLQAAYTEQRSARRRAVAARRALDTLQEAVQTCPACYRAYDLRGSAQLLLGRPDQAVESYQTAIRYIPSSELYTNLGVAYMTLGRRQEALSSLRTALNYRPGYAQARLALRQLEQQSR